MVSCLEALHDIRGHNVAVRQIRANVAEVGSVYAAVSYVVVPAKFKVTDDFVCHANILRHLLIFRPKVKWIPILA